MIKKKERIKEDITDTTDNKKKKKKVYNQRLPKTKKCKKFSSFILCTNVYFFFFSINNSVNWSAGVSLVAVVFFFCHWLYSAILIKQIPFINYNFHFKMCYNQKKNSEHRLKLQLMFQHFRINETIH